MENESGFKHLTSQKGSFWRKGLLPADDDGVSAQQWLQGTDRRGLRRASSYSSVLDGKNMGE